jgi:hypothetical protein
VRWIFVGGIAFFTYEWFEHARHNPDALFLAIAVDLGFALVFVILTEPRDGKVSSVSRWAAQTAAQHGPGGWELGVRWTSWRYLIPALIILDMLVSVARVGVDRPGFRPLDLLWLAIMAIPAVVWIRKVLVGACRRVYIFDGGFVVARGRRCQVYPYDELVDTAVWLPGGLARPRIRLRRGTGRWLIINQETAVRTISARVPHQQVYD